jgi:AcrR family transcriptional regulator
MTAAAASAAQTTEGGAARRSRRPAAERRGQILAAARTLFAQRGFHATTTRDLAAAADINDALIYRYFADKQQILTALMDEAIAVFQAMPPPPSGTPLPLDVLLELIGNGFVQTARANLDLVTILISEHQSLAGDTRFVAFIDQAATRLGALIDEISSGPSAGGPSAGGPSAGGPSAGEAGAGYLTARSFFGSLIAFVLLQDLLGLSQIRPVEASDYVRHLARQAAHAAVQH